MENLSITDKMVLIGSIGVGVFLLMEYAHVVPDLTTKNPDLIVHLWIAWIVISGLSLSVGIIVKIINRKTS